MPGFLFTPLARWIGAAVLVLVILGAVYLKGRHDVQVNFDEYKAEVKALAAAQEEKTNQINTKNQRLLLETKNAYNSQLANLRTYYSMRINKSGLSLPATSVAAGGIDAYSPDNLPPTAVLAAQCAETTLTLIMLQNYERLKASNME